MCPICFDALERNDCPFCDDYDTTEYVPSVATLFNGAPNLNTFTENEYEGWI